jgi:hypothetical protein
MPVLLQDDRQELVELDRHLINEKRVEMLVS